MDKNQASLDAAPRLRVQDESQHREKFARGDTRREQAKDLEKLSSVNRVREWRGKKHLIYRPSLKSTISPTNPGARLARADSTVSLRVVVHELG